MGRSSSRLDEENTRRRTMSSISAQLDALAVGGGSGTFLVCCDGRGAHRCLNAISQEQLAGISNVVVRTSLQRTHAGDNGGCLILFNSTLEGDRAALHLHDVASRFSERVQLFLNW